MSKNDWDLIGKLASELMETELPKEFEKEARRPNRFIGALKKHPRNILRKKNVVGVGYGFRRKNGVFTDQEAPTVYVKKKVALNRLKPADRIPRSITIRGKRHAIAVLEVGEMEELCAPGNPAAQRQLNDPYQPGCSIIGLQPPRNIPVTRGSGGCCVRRRGDPTSPIWLLTNAHVINPNWNVAHPRPNRVVGAWVATAGNNYDAVICEIRNAIIEIKCLGNPMMPVRPMLGMRVKKSGAGTGITSSRVVQIAAIPQSPGNTIVIDNTALEPAAPPPNFQPYLDDADSGSVTVLGGIAQPDDFGPVVNLIVQIVAAFSLPGLAPWVALIMRARLRNAVIGLNFGVGMVGPGKLSTH